MTQTAAQHGGSRPKRRPDDARGGERPGSGRLLQRIHLDRDTAQVLRRIIARRNLTGVVTESAYVQRLILADAEAGGIELIFQEDES